MIDNDARRVARLAFSGESEDFFEFLELIGSTHINNLRGALVAIFNASEHAKNG